MTRRKEQGSSSYISESDPNHKYPNRRVTIRTWFTTCEVDPLNAWPWRPSSRTTKRILKIKQKNRIKSNIPFTCCSLSLSSFVERQTSNGRRTNRSTFQQLDVFLRTQLYYGLDRVLQAVSTNYGENQVEREFCRIITINWKWKQFRLNYYWHVTSN